MLRSGLRSDNGLGFGPLFFLGGGPMSYIVVVPGEDSGAGVDATDSEAGVEATD